MPKPVMRNLLLIAFLSLTVAGTSSPIAFARGYQVPPFLSNDDVVRVFPGAEGFGTQTSAGRDGRICFVENLDDDGPGSLRSCVDRDHPRIILFRVGGTIEVETPIEIASPGISIYGQSAPGGGILVRASQTTKGSPMVIRTHDVLVQHLRLRAGTSLLQTCCRDALRIGSAEPGQVYNVVLDHNSLSWGTDQIANTWYDTNNVTFSYNLIAESLHDNGSNKDGPAGRGLLIGSEGAHSFSIHHNVIAHSYQRNPLLVTNGVVDVVNNIVYHWVSRGGEQRSTYPDQRVNWVKNRYLARQRGFLRRSVTQGSSVGWGDILLAEKDYPLTASVYLEGNLGMSRKWSWQSEWKIANTDHGVPYDPKLGFVVDQRFPAPPITEMPAGQLLDRLLPVVGAIAPERDAVDSRVVNQISRGSGVMPNCVGADDIPGGDGAERCQLNVGGWPVMHSGMFAPDSDNDGLPDEWELAVNLDPNSADSQIDSNADGYTNLEDWLNHLSKASVENR
jgi:pectate lyase